LSYEAQGSQDLHPDW